ncbi:unnamed protein product [Effrenium voratum]|uniref:Uncharacterized protein n=1 Tax=Effrenium voratum TaxID=2562239 RepID=A0AA36IZ30_9DINO|nr:unnamed protein product [Effrenium voratum]
MVAPGGKLDLWNQEYPFAKVEPCDFVAEVNGETGIQAMMRELSKRSAVRLRILRFPSPFTVKQWGLFTVLLGFRIRSWSLVTSGIRAERDPLKKKTVMVHLGGGIGDGRALGGMKFAVLVELVEVTLESTERAWRLEKFQTGRCLDGGASGGFVPIDIQCIKSDAALGPQVAYLQSWADTSARYHPPMNNRDRGLVIKVLDSRMDEHNKTSVRRKNFHHVVMNGMVIEGAWFYVNLWRAHVAGVNDVEGAGQKLQRALLEAPREGRGGRRGFAKGMVQTEDDLAMRQMGWPADEASGDDRGRSPRGAGGFATRAAEFAERRLAEGREPEFGRRGSRKPWQGQAFGAAPPEARPELELDGGRRDKVSELRDYSSRLWRDGAPGKPQPGASKDAREAAREAARDAAEAKELALLTGGRPSLLKQDAAGKQAIVSEEQEKKKDKTGKRDKKDKKDKKSKKDKKAKKVKKDKKEKKKKHKKEKGKKDSSSSSSSS